MAKIANAYYSQVHAKTIRIDGKRIAQQIIACIKHCFPSLQLTTSEVLDIGGSSGAIAYHLAANVKNIISIDVDRHAYSHGVKKYRKGNFSLRLFDGIKLPFPGGSFDIVIFRRAYGSIDDPNAMTREIWRVLKSGGVCYFEGHNKLFFYENDHRIPTLTILPDILAKNLVLFIKRKKSYYIERYKTYWGIQKMFSSFTIHKVTAEIVKNPKKFSFKRLYNLGLLTKYIPLSLLKLAEPFLYPDFIWLLKREYPQ